MAQIGRYLFFELLVEIGITVLCPCTEIHQELPWINNAKAWYVALFIGE